MARPAVRGPVEVGPKAGRVAEEVAKAAVEAKAGVVHRAAVEAKAGVVPKQRPAEVMEMTCAAAEPVRGLLATCSDSNIFSFLKPLT